MNANINIKKANFQFAMDSEEMAFDLYASWSSFYESAFVRIVEKVLERFNPPGQLISIGTLELNLGLIPRDEFYNRFPLLLEEKLEELMQKLMLAGTPGEIKKISKNLSLFEAVTYYLIHGYYPWSMGRIQKDFNVLFIEMLSEYTKDMCEFLRAYGHYSSMRKRLVFQLENAGLQQLVSAVNPVESNFIITYFNLLINKQTHKKISKATVKEHRNAVWQVILSYLLVQKAGYFNRREFVEQTIRELAAHYGLEYRTLLDFLGKVVTEMTSNINFHSEFGTILTELTENANAEDPGNKNSSLKILSELETILKNKAFSASFNSKALLLQFQNENFRKHLSGKFNYESIWTLSEITDRFLSSETDKKIATYYFSLILEVLSGRDVEKHLQIIKWEESADKKVHPVFHESLRELLKQPQTRRKLIEKLSEKEIYSLVKWLVPGEKKFVISYAEMLDKQSERNAFEGRTGGEFKTLKWEFIFTILIEHADSSFNRKTFVFSVVIMLAAHYNLPVYDLLRFIYQTFIDQIVEVDKSLYTIISELYFEEKEKRTTRQKINSFDKALQEEFYFNLLREFIQTGTISSVSFLPKLYDVLQYLKIYRPDLLESLTEELKIGFLIIDLKPIPQHKAFYRELILFVVAHYRLNLPGGKKVKSLFENIAEDRFKAVSVTTFKTMLLALLKNDLKLYEKAWALLVNESGSELKRHDSPLDFISNNLVLNLFFNPEPEETKNFLQDNSHAIAERIFSSEKMMEKLAATYQIDKRVPNLFIYVLQQLSPDFIYRKLIRLYPAKSKQIKVIFRWLVQTDIAFTDNRMKLLFVGILLLLVSEEPQLLGKSIRLMLSSGITETAKDQLIKSIDDPAIQERTVNWLQQFEKSEPTKDSEDTHSLADDNFIEWLTLHFGKKRDPVFEAELSSGKLYHSLAYKKFEELLAGQSELIKKQVDSGLLSKYKITQWIKSAPKSAQLRWLKVIAEPYQRNALNDVFRFVEWIRQCIGKMAGITFNGQKILELLVEFCSGKLQNISEKNLYNLIFHEGIQHANEAQWLQILSTIQSKAVNGGKLWKQKLSHLSRLPQASSKVERENQLKSKTQMNQAFTEDSDSEILEEIFINNAGLVLCNPFLPRLFSLLELTADGAFKDRQSKGRGVLLLQYMLFESTMFPEHFMVLNKLLCGLETGIPVDCHIDAAQQEKETLEQMLKGIIQHWNKLGSTSVKGLIGSFLIREGKLEQKEDAWYLKVEQKGYDLLLDSIPWSFSPIKYLWMKKPLFVKWR